MEKIDTDYKQRNLKSLAKLFKTFNRDCAPLRMFIAGHSVAMVTYFVTKIIPTCLPVIGKVFDTMVVLSIDKDWL